MENSASGSTARAKKTTQGTVRAQQIVTTQAVTDEAVAEGVSEDDVMSDDEDSAQLMLMESDVSLPRGKWLFVCIVGRLFLRLLPINERPLYD